MLKLPKILILSLFLPFYCLSQDAIIKLDGSEIKGKVLEIGVNEIKYIKDANTPSPGFSVPKKEVLIVIYADGRKEIISKPISLNSSNPLIKKPLEQFNKVYLQKVYPFYNNQQVPLKIYRQNLKEFSPQEAYPLYKKGSNAYFLTNATNGILVPVFIASVVSIVASTIYYNQRVDNINNASTAYGSSTDYSYEYKQLNQMKDVMTIAYPTLGISAIGITVGTIFRIKGIKQAKQANDIYNQVMTNN